ncbi:FO synthase [Desulfitobacterium sp.]|uniref:FO synthase n=1 Tax=Desulfitobacterium sp. TaxID=49981 RepID=UPI002B6AEB2A|nr:FO synthase [Desulfitobacterium sp.]HVJ48105.1 FO synthase [Desulfitobacterium sp.]
MLSLFAQSELKDLIEKVEKEERLDYKAGVRLMKSKDILALGYLANSLRERKNGDQTYFLGNRQGFENQDATHRLDIKTNAPMQYGQGETVEERIDHLLQLRELQDKTGGFLSFTPFAGDPKNTKIKENMGVESTTGFEDLRMLAVSRILLDNFDHIKAFWRVLGPKLAQVSLEFGVDDLDGTVVEDKNTPAAGADTEQVMYKKALIKMIHKAGRHAIERDTLYQVIKDYGRAGGQD